MRVLAMFHAYVPFHNAGAEVMAHQLLRELVTAGHDVDVLMSVGARGITRPYEVDGVRVHPYGGKTDPMRFLTNHDLRPHAIVSHLENVPRACALGKMFSIPVVDIVHNTLTQTKAHIEHGPVSLIVFNAEWVRADYETFWEQHNRYPLPRNVVVHPPVDIGRYATKPGDRVTLINLTEAKGAPLFYRLAEAMPDRKFLGVIGGYGPQIIRDDLPNVQIVEQVSPDQMPAKVYGRTKVLLAPSSYESYGRVAAEAICSGIPVIAHPTPGLRECLGDAGIFHDRDDTDAWAATLAKLHTPRGWSTASKLAKARAKTLDAAGAIERWTHAIEGVTGRVLAPTG